MNEKNVMLGAVETNQTEVLNNNTFKKNFRTYTAKFVSAMNICTKKLISGYRLLVRLSSMLVRAAVELSIITIAVIMLFNFAKENPAEWGNLVESVNNVLGLIKDALLASLRPITILFHR